MAVLHISLQIYIRKLLGYLALGNSPAEGLRRFLVTCVEKDPLTSPPALNSHDALTVHDTYTACMAMGVRPPTSAVPLPAKFSFVDFRRLLRTQGKLFDGATTTTGPDTGEAPETPGRVNLVEFLDSAACSEVLSHVGYLFVRRDVEDFLYEK